MFAILFVKKMSDIVVIQSAKQYGIFKRKNIVTIAIWCIPLILIIIVIRIIIAIRIVTKQHGTRKQNNIVWDAIWCIQLSMIIVVLAHKKTPSPKKDLYGKKQQVIIVKNAIHQVQKYHDIVANAKNGGLHSRKNIATNAIWCILQNIRIAAGALIHCIVTICTITANLAMNHTSKDKRIVANAEHIGNSKPNSSTAANANINGMKIKYTVKIVV
jgi:hypothetical protein